MEQPPSYDPSNNTLYNNQPSSSFSATNTILVENEKTVTATSDAIAADAAAGSSPQPAKKEVKKTRKPRDTALTQQRLKAWQPILSPPWVIASFLIIFVVFTALGILLILTSESVVEVEMDYTDLCIQNRTADTGAPYCLVDREQTTFTLTRYMKAPIYLYYKLENFYQNHRRYASSRSDVQLAGSVVSYSTASSSCSPIVINQASQDNSSASIADVYSPCGLIAWSMFNDTFLLYNGTNEDEVICNGPDPTSSSCTKKGIAWESDVNVKFKRPTIDSTSIGNRMYNQSYFNETGHLIPDVTDEDFIVWMRTAALPTFRKLHRIIQVDMPPGNYSMEIESRFPVSSFGGRKKFVLSTSSWIGGKNLFLSIAYLVVGGLCFILAILFAFGAIVQKIRMVSMKNQLQQREPSTAVIPNAQ